MPRAVVGLDIGGAHLKTAHGSKVSTIAPFALWKNPARLAANIRKLIAPMPPFDLAAVTMTGELCDCFPSKQAGVRHIVRAVRKTLPDKPLMFWRNDAKFVGFDEALQEP